VFEVGVSARVPDDPVDGPEPEAVTVRQRVHLAVLEDVTLVRPDAGTVVLDGEHELVGPFGDGYADPRVGGVVVDDGVLQQTADREFEFPSASTNPSRGRSVSTVTSSKFARNHSMASETTWTRSVSYRSRSTSTSFSMARAFLLVSMTSSHVRTIVSA